MDPPLDRDRGKNPLVIPTEPIGSIPRPGHRLEAMAGSDIDNPDVTSLYEASVRDTVVRLEATGSPVITDGEQRKYHNFWTYGSWIVERGSRRIQNPVLSRA